MDNQEKILSIKIDYAEAIKAIADYQQKIDDLKESEKELKKQFKDGQISQKQYREEMAASKIQTQQYSEAISIITKEVKNSIKSDKQKDTSLKGLRASLSNLTAEYDALSREERNSAKGKELQKHINEITREIKSAEEGTGRFYRNVGNYFNSLDGTFKGLASTIIQFGRDAKYSFDLATAGANGTSKAIKALSVIVKASLIGIIIAAVGALATAFTRTQQGMETFQRAMSQLGAIFDVILDRIAMLGSSMVALFKLDFAGAKNAAMGALKDIGKEIREEVKQADELRKSMFEIEKQETELAVKRSNHRAEIERLKQIAEDTTRAEKERLEAARQAYAIEQADLNDMISLQEKRLANMLGYTEVTKEVRNVIDQLNRGTTSADEVISKLGISASTINDFKQFADEVINLNEMRENSLTRQIEQQNKVNTLQKEYNEALEKERKHRKLTAAYSEEEYKEQTKFSFLKMAHLKSEKELTKNLNVETIEDRKKRKDAELAIELEKYNSMKEIAGNMMAISESLLESDKAAAVAGKVITLAQIAISTGEAIAKMTAKEAGKGIMGLLTMATGITTIIANMAMAIKTVKSAKFSTGGDVSGKGTSTSDSIPAMLSDGESVMTAKATSMFAPILSAFNQAGGGVPIYGQQAGSRAMGEDMLAKSIEKGMRRLPSPIVSVEEISKVSNRIKVIENINKI